MVVDGPIDNVDFITLPASSTDSSDETDSKGKEDEDGEEMIGTDDEKGVKPEKPADSSSQNKQYLYYISNNKVFMVNKDNPEDKRELSRTGATKYAIDGSRDVLFYVMFDRNIVREDIGEGGSPNFIVTGIGSVGDLILDTENNVVYFTDTKKGQIEKYDIDSEFRRVLYRNLREPRNLSLANRFVGF